MKLYPAIDLRGGQAVRLYQGDYDQMTVYNADPAAQAREFIAAGAKYLHVVDLDGAKDDTTANMTTIAATEARKDFFDLIKGGLNGTLAGIKKCTEKSWIFAQGENIHPGSRFVKLQATGIRRASAGRLCCQTGKCDATRAGILGINNRNLHTLEIDIIAAKISQNVFPRQSAIGW